MKVDVILLALIGVVLLLIVAGLGVGVLMIFLGGDDTPDTPSVSTKYQCFDGSVVNRLRDCPDAVSSVVTTSPSIGVTITCPKTSCPKCPSCAEGTKATSRPTTTTTLCDSCSATSVLSSCGLAYTDHICRNGDVWEVTYNPICSEGCCKWSSGMKSYRACSDRERCEDGACVDRNDD